VETTTAIELAREAKAPVRVAYDRHEELSVTGYRPATEVKIALLPSEQGELKALSLTAYADTGRRDQFDHRGAGPPDLSGGSKRTRRFRRHQQFAGRRPFRGPGGPPMAFALEQAIDEAALRMNVDPIALRKRWDPDPNRQRLYDWASGLEVWRNRKPIAAQSGRYRRGVGVATGYWLYLWQPGSKVEVAVKGGRLIASTATQDIGTGTRTVIANTVAREFGLEPHEIEVRIGDSNLPEGPGLGRQPGHGFGDPADAAGDRAVEGVDPATRKAATGPGSNAPWREMLAASPDLSASSVRPEDSKQMAPGVESPLKQAGFMGWIFGWMMRRFSNLAIGAGVPSSVQVVEVEVDTWLGHVRVVKRSHRHCGRQGRSARAGATARRRAPSSRASATRSMKAREVDSRTGDVLSGGMEDYRIPGIADTP
jgi:xanthine dehydrogenase YagR molybdenum-binding subunit